VDAIWDKVIFRKAARGPVGVKIDLKEISGMIPSAAKPVMDMPRMVGTLQPETCYTVPASEEKK